VALVDRQNLLQRQQLVLPRVLATSLGKNMKKWRKPWKTAWKNRQKARENMETLEILLENPRKFFGDGNYG